MSAITAFIVEDELHSREFLQKMLIENFPDLEVCGAASTVQSALDGIQLNKPSLIFLDVQLQGESGFDLLNKLPQIDFPVIFTTAYDTYAIRAFRFNAIDYLLKPIIIEELIAAVNKARKYLPHANEIKEQVIRLSSDIKSPGKIFDKIVVPNVEGYVIVPLNEIIYCKASNNYTEFYLADSKRILSAYTLKEYDELLSGGFFLRVHRSYLVNMNHVKKYKKGDGGEITMSNGDEIELSRNHKNAFLQFLNIRQ